MWITWSPWSDYIVLVNAGRVTFEQAEQHFLDAAGAGGLELPSDSGLQGCVADFDGHGWLLGVKGTGKSGANQQNRQPLAPPEEMRCI
jgi:hypothetical protein